MRIEINDSLLNRRVQRLEVRSQAERSGAVKTLDVVPYEEAAHRQTLVRRAPDDSEHVNNGQVSQETIGGVIENVADGVLSAAHDALHTVNRAQVVAAIDPVAAPCAHENVLVVIGHADDFVGHDLADGENEIEAAKSCPTKSSAWPITTRTFSWAQGA